MKRETRVMTKEDAVAFFQNMRWFAGFGRIIGKPFGKARRFYRVTASRAAWSNWVS